METARLILRPLQQADAAAIVQQVGEYDVAKYLSRVPYPYTQSNAEEFLDWVSNPAPRSLYRAICLKDDPEMLLGIASYEWAETTQDTEFGYWLAKPFWGQGLMTETASAMVQHAFLADHHQALFAGYFLGNEASLRVLTKLGFVVDGPKKIFSRAQGIEVDAMQMVLTQERWRSRNMPMDVDSS